MIRLLAQGFAGVGPPQGLCQIRVEVLDEVEESVPQVCTRIGLGVEPVTAAMRF
jgi:hypothetical protein